MKTFLLFLATVFATFVSLYSQASEKPLTEMRIDGMDAKLLSNALISSGIKKEEVAVRNVPGDHDLSKVPTRSVYRVESVVCKDQKCTPFTVDTAQMKKIDSLFRKLGAEVTPAPKGQKNGKAIVFVKEVLCEAPTSKDSLIVCYATAHFKPKK